MKAEQTLAEFAAQCQKKIKEAIKNGVELPPGSPLSKCECDIQPRQRRAQFMGNMREKTLIPFNERLNARRHLVEDPGQIPKFVFAPDGGRDHSGF